MHRSQQFKAAEQATFAERTPVRLLLPVTPYSVDICDAWGYLQSESGEEFPHFNLFVEPQQILIYSEGDVANLLERFGVSPGRVSWDEQ